MVRVCADESRQSRSVSRLQDRLLRCRHGAENLVGTPMATTELQVCDGPDRSELLRSLANPARQIAVQFRTSDGAFDAVIDQMGRCALAGGNGLALEGHICSGIYSGLCFAGTYDLDTKTGLLAMHIPSDAAPAL